MSTSYGTLWNESDVKVPSPNAIHIFDIANSTMMYFDIALAFQNVSKLKEAIEQKCKIRPSHQVLLMSGGESLGPDVQISSYSTGTESNPVYLFNTNINDAGLISLAASIFTNEYEEPPLCELQRRVFESEKMLNNYPSFVERVKIAEKFYSTALQQTRDCENLVRDQHFQQQGWHAVVVNLDDVIQACQVNADILAKNFDTYIADREDHLDILKNLDKVIEVLANIPILRGLREKCVDTSYLLANDTINSSASSFANNSTNFSDHSFEERLTLLNWISGERLKNFAEQCERGLKRLDNRTMGVLKLELDTVIEAANEQNLREIKNVCERLYLLEQMRAQMKLLLKNQVNLLQRFYSDKYKELSLMGEGTISDMTLQHHDWLLLMLQNYNSMRDIWQRCIKAKEKLFVSVHRRLQRVIVVEKSIAEVNDKLVMYNDSLTLLCKELEILRQVHLTPSMYVSAVVEVVRRKNFSQAFLTWANDLVDQMQALHKEESDKRKAFQSKFEGHFLNELFTGLEDVPPTFATEAPPAFDEGLPNLTMESLNILKNQMPDLDLSFTLPNLKTNAVSFFANDMASSDEWDNMGCKPLSNNTSNTVEPGFTRSFLQNHHSLMRSFLVENKKDESIDSECNITNIIQSFDESLKIRTRRLCEERQGLRVVNKFELLDFNNLLQTREEKINSLKSLIAEKETESKNDHVLLLMQQKLKFEQENLAKLQAIHKSIKSKKNQAKEYQEKLAKDAKEVKMLESIFKLTLDKYEKTCKELYDDISPLL